MLLIVSEEHELVNVIFSDYMFYNASVILKDDKFVTAQKVRNQHSLVSQAPACWLWLRYLLEVNSIMTYRERLHYWAIARLLPTQQWAIIARYRSRSDADGHFQFLRRKVPNVLFKVVFDVTKAN